jgi:electron transport complex protein RnfD
MALLKIAGYKPSPMDGTFTAQLNGSVLSFLGVEVPGGYVDFFGHTAPGIIADRGLGTLLLATIVLAASRSTKSFIPAIFLAVFLGLVRAFGGLPYGGTPLSGDMLFSLLTGGTILAAFLLSADPSTGPKSVAGAMITASLSGAMAFALRFFGAQPYGAAIAVAFVDSLVPVARRIERRALYMDWRTP